MDTSGQMKKTFSLTSPTHQSARVVEQIKSDIRKYLKRERRKPLPEGIDFWDFVCKVGCDAATPEAKHVEEIVGAIDQASAGQCGAIYIEILAKPGHRTKKSTD